MQNFLFREVGQFKTLSIINEILISDPVFHSMVSLWSDICSGLLLFFRAVKPWVTYPIGQRMNATVKRKKEKKGAGKRERLDFRVDEPQRQQGNRKWMKSHHMGKRYRRLSPVLQRTLCNAPLWAAGRSLAGLQFMQGPVQGMHAKAGVGWGGQNSALAISENKLCIPWKLT